MLCFPRVLAIAANNTFLQSAFIEALPCGHLVVFFAPFFFEISYDPIT